MHLHSQPVLAQTVVKTEDLHREKVLADEVVGLRVHSGFQQANCHSKRVIDSWLVGVPFREDKRATFIVGEFVQAYL